MPSFFLSSQSGLDHALKLVTTYIRDHLFLDIPLQNWVTAIAILLGSFLLHSLLARFLQFLLGCWRWHGRAAGKAIAQAILPALKLLIITTGFSIATQPTLLDFPKKTAAFMADVSATLQILVVCLLIQGIGQGLVNLRQELSSARGKSTSVTIYGVYKKAITVGTIILGLFMILKVWGFDISSLVAGLGIGGLALSLAAQDTFSNLLGGITIMTDRAFEIGDVISTPEIEGVVEEIGFRSTKVRTFTQAQVNIPNAKLSNAYVTNLSRMGKRRIRFTIRVPYSVSADQIRVLAERMMQVTRRREAILADGILFYLDKFGPSAQEILFQCFVNLVDYDVFVKEQQDVMFELRRIMNEMNIPLAMDALQVQLVDPERQPDRPAERPPEKPQHFA